MTRTPEHLLDLVGETLHELRVRAPLVQCITNSVAANYTANVLLGLGASPAMVDIPGESGPFASVASGLLINLGTPTAEQREAMLEAVVAANQEATPWVLDPVAVGALPIRTALSQELSYLTPTVVRGNASEIIALGGAGSGGRGVDALDAVDAALPAARSLAERTGGVVAVSGPVDIVTDGRAIVRIANGSHWLTRVTGGGCALGATMAAFASVNEDPFVSTVAAITVYCVAAELAASRASGPGSFAVAFLDSLASVDTETIRRSGKIS